MNQPYAKLKQECEEWLRAGKSALVLQSLSLLNSARLPRDERLPLARLARRAHDPRLALRLLSPVIGGDKKRYDKSATPAEFAEYGILLIQVGSYSEGIAILKSLNANAEALLFQAFGLFNQWNYAQAQPLLEKYIVSEGLSDYQRAVGEVNLLSALIATGQWERAREYSEALLACFRECGYGRLHANVLEMRGQIFIGARDFAAAGQALEEAATLLNEDQTFDRFAIEKWNAVLAAQKTGDPRPLLEFRARAERRPHPESVREADFHLYKLSRDRALFDHLYFGTAHPPYRERLAQVHGDKPAAEYLLGGGEQTLELSLGKLNGRELLDPGKKVHQLVCLLLSDFYKPFQAGTIFSRLFPDEHFNIFSSPLRVHQLIFRTRRIFEENKIPLTITERDGFYHFMLEPGLSIRLRDEAAPQSSEDGYLRRLTEHFGVQEFSAREARESLSFSATTMNRVLKYGLESGALVQLGSGPRTRYKAAKKAAA